MKIILLALLLSLVACSSRPSQDQSETTFSVDDFRENSSMNQEQAEEEELNDGSIIEHGYVIKGKI